MKETHDHRICPVWLGYLLANPLRALFQNPEKILAPYVKPGMHVMDVGPGMGFFSLPMARLVGPGGRVFCVDIQEKMLNVLMRRAQGKGLADRIETRVCDADSLRVTDLASKIDLVLACAVVHEIRDNARFFSEVQSVLKPHGLLLFAEPGGHVTPGAFQESIAAAERCGLSRRDSLKFTGFRAALLEKA